MDPCVTIKVLQQLRPTHTWMLVAPLLGRGEAGAPEGMRTTSCSRSLCSMSASTLQRSQVIAQICVDEGSTGTVPEGLLNPG